jgi:ABC-type siderophore export system fused ATPase/permease subunit
MDPAWGGIIVTLLIGLVGSAVGIHQSRQAKQLAERTQSSTDRQGDYDQLQEDLRELRADVDRQAARAKDRELRDAREIRYQAGIIRALTDDVNDLRKLMADAGLPLPARRDWPPYPGEWVERS